MGRTKKTATAADAKSLTDLPNVGEKTAADLRLIGFDEPAKMKGQDPFRTYVRLCEKTKKYHDPCMLDVFIAVTNFMDGGCRRDWWGFTEERKANFHRVADKVQKFRLVTTRKRR